MHAWPAHSLAGSLPHASLALPLLAPHNPSSLSPPSSDYAPLPCPLQPPHHLHAYELPVLAPFSFLSSALLCAPCHVCAAVAMAHLVPFFSYFYFFAYRRLAF
ncbi:hypothetical protein COCHEDRAFT_1196128, partial [Bipolaris maydis C5]